MANIVIMPKLGNSVESCIINQWHKQVGDVINEGDILCEAETDKAVVEVESTASGTLLAQFFAVGDEVAVMMPLVAVGQPGENIDDLSPDQVTVPAVTVSTAPPAAEATPDAVATAPLSVNGDQESSSQSNRLKISPRAKALTERKKIDLALLTGSGPAGRIIERDVQAAIEAQPAMTPLARKMITTGDFDAPDHGSGVRGRITAADLSPLVINPPVPPKNIEDTSGIEIVPLKGVRKVIAARLLESLQTTAQLTFNASASAQVLQAYRQRLKDSNESLGLQQVTINDLILLAVSRILPRFPDMNAHFTGEALHRHKNVQLGMAVDTPRGLIVPVIRQANLLSLKQISHQAKQLVAACLDGKIGPDELSGGTFTVSNLGIYGIESFTPILNPPEVGVLGVGGISLKPVATETGVEFIPHLALSLTVNHQIIDVRPRLGSCKPWLKGWLKLIYYWRSKKELHYDQTNHH